MKLIALVISIFLSLSGVDAIEEWPISGRCDACFAGIPENIKWENEQRKMWSGPWAASALEPLDSLKEQDGEKIFTAEWFARPEVKTTLEENIKKRQIIAHEDKKPQAQLETTTFVDEWITVAKETCQKGDDKCQTKKTKGFLALLKKFGLSDSVLPEKPGKECLWSGHVENSNYARTTDQKTPLETPPLMQVLSGTFGTEHFKQGTSSKKSADGKTVEYDGFGQYWLPNICPMFNAATEIYSSNMKPDGKTLPVYVNQIKEWSAFFESEIPLFMGSDQAIIENIEFIILKPPPTPLSVVKKITVKVGTDAASTQKAVVDAFKNLEEADVKLLWDAQFNVAMNDNKATYGSAESHPFAEADAGTRKKDDNAEKIYGGFFKNCPDAIKGAAAGGGGAAAPAADAKKPTTHARANEEKSISVSFNSDKFGTNLIIVTLLLFCAIVIYFFKFAMTQKSELKIVFNTESPAHYTEFAQI